MGRRRASERKLTFRIRESAATERPPAVRNAAASLSLKATTPVEEACLVEGETVAGPVTPAPRDEPQRPEAILVVHGMGQQVPFETLDLVLRGLQGAVEREAAARKARTPAGEPLTLGEVRPAQRTIEGENLRHLEVGVGGRRFHLYESYWAPLTEGKVRLTDVLAFMVGGGLNGLAAVRRGFQRWSFGDVIVDEEPPAPPEGADAAPAGGARWKKRRFIATGGLIFVLFLLLGALALLNLVLVAVATATDDLPGPHSLAELKGPLGALFLAYAALLLPLVVLYALAGRLHARARDKHAGVRSGGRGHAFGRFVSWVAWGYVVVALAATYAVAAAVALMLFFGAGLDVDVAWPARVDLSGGLFSDGAQLVRWTGGFLGGLVSGFLAGVAWLGARMVAAGGWLAGALGAWSVAATFAVLGAAAWFVRNALVQYLGDVAAYVSPHKLDRFQDLRKAIKDEVRGTARRVYARRGEDGSPLYAHVHVVAHSLGSVAAYDAVNALLNDDDNGGPKDRLDVRTRTRLFLTFGSPLDKLSFLFGVNSPEIGKTRAALAALPQPMIRDYGLYRGFRWINFYSPHDPISGKLDFFDHPRERARSPPAVNVVENRLDREAYVPLACHTHYWKNEAVWDALLESCLGSEER